MSDTERVRAWRQRLKDSGLIAVTLWLRPETKARYEDLALTHRRSLSELAQLALEAYRLDPTAVAAPGADAAQLRALIRDELDQTTAIITATVTATVTEALTAMLPAIVETTLQRDVPDTVTETETATPQEPLWLTTVEAFVSDMATDTDAAGSALPQEPLAPSVSDTETDTVTETTAPTTANPEAAMETSPAPRGRRTARGPARRRKAPTRSN